MIRFAFIGFALLLTQACTTSYSISALPNEGQEERYFDGVRLVISELPNSSAIVLPPSRAVEDRGRLEVMLINTGIENVDFGTENFSALSSSGETVRVYSYSELLAEEKTRQMWAAIAAGLEAAGNSMQAANAGYTTSYGSYSGMAYGAGSTAYTSGSGYVTTYDPAKAQMARSLADQRNTETFDRMAYENKKNEMVLQNILKTTTIVPGGSHSGIIIFDLPKKNELEEERLVSLRVSAGELAHVFTIAIRPAP